MISAPRGGFPPSRGFALPLHVKVAADPEKTVEEIFSAVRNDE